MMSVCFLCFCVLASFLKWLSEVSSEFAFQDPLTRMKHVWKCIECCDIGLVWQIVIKYAITKMKIWEEKNMQVATFQYRLQISMSIIVSMMNHYIYKVNLLLPSKHFCDFFTRLYFKRAQHRATRDNFCEECFRG